MIDINITAVHHKAMTSQKLIKFLKQWDYTTFVIFRKNKTKQIPPKNHYVVHVYAVQIGLVKLIIISTVTP